MQIDPNQPIMFDNETMPGIGRGYWQANPFTSIHHDDDNVPTGSSGSDKISPRAIRIMQVAIFSVATGFFVIGGFVSFL